MTGAAAGGGNPPGAIRRRLGWLRWPLAGSAGLLVLAVPAGAGWYGGTGALAAGAGVLVVVASYLVSGVAIAWADSVDPKLVLPVGLGMYIAKFALLGVVLLSVAATGWAGIAPMAAAMAVAIVVWVTAQVWWTWRARLPYVELPERQ